MKRILITIAAIATPLLAAEQVRAGLIGDDVNGQWFYPNLSTPIQNMGTTLVNPTAVFELLVGGSVTHQVFTTVTDQNISISVTNDAGDHFGSATFNGPSLDFLSPASQITGISIDPATNVAGFNLSQVSLVSDGSGGQFVDINVQGLTIPTNNWLVSLDVKSVPEPSTLVLGALGLLGLGFVARNKKFRHA
jgi:hypothetical protein